MPEGYMDAAAVPVPDAGDDTLRVDLIRVLESDEWMRRHFGIAAHAHDVVDALLPRIREHVAAAVQGERERVASRMAAAENEHETFLRELDDAFGLEDGEESRYSNPEGSAESIYLDVARAYKREVDAVERVRALGENWLRLSREAMDQDVREWTNAAGRSVFATLDGTEAADGTR